MHKAYDAARTFAHAQSEAHLHTRLQQYATAHDACEQAITLYDPLDVLRHWRREAFHVCSPHGALRPQENVRSALALLFDMIDALNGAAIPQTLKPLGQHIDDLFVPLQHVDAIAAALRAVVPHDA